MTLSFLKKIYYLPLLAIFFISPQIDNLLIRFAEESINDGSELRTDGYFFSIFNIIISFLGFVYKKNKFIALYLLYSIICLLILFYLNPFLYGRFSFYNYLFFAYFVSKFCNRYVIVGFLFLGESSVAHIPPLRVKIFTGIFIILSNSSICAAFAELFLTKTQ